MLKPNLAAPSENPMVHSGEEERLLGTLSLLEPERSFCESRGVLQVNVTVWDVNDNAPRFESAVLQLSLPENVAVGTATYVAQAQDADAGRNGAVRYSLLEGSAQGPFELGPRSGRLSLRQPLDYETQPRVRLVLGAADGGSPPRSASMTLLVEVQDVNDNAPLFDRPHYSVSLLESLPANAHVLQVSTFLSPPVGQLPPYVFMCLFLAGVAIVCTSIICTSCLRCTTTLAKTDCSCLGGRTCADRKFIFYF